MRQDPIWKSGMRPTLISRPHCAIDNADDVIVNGKIDLAMVIAHAAGP